MSPEINIENFTPEQRARYDFLSVSSLELNETERLFLATVESQEQTQDALKAAFRELNRDQISHKTFADFCTALNAVDMDNIYRGVDLGRERSNNDYLEGLVTVKNSLEEPDSIRQVAISGGVDIDDPGIQDQMYSKSVKKYDYDESQKTIGERDAVRDVFANRGESAVHFNALTDLLDKNYKEILANEVIENPNMPIEMKRFVVRQKLAAQAYQNTRMKVKFMFDRYTRHVNRSHDTIYTTHHRSAEEYWQKLLVGGMNGRMKLSPTKTNAWTEGIEFSVNYAEELSRRNQAELSEFYGDDSELASIVWNSVLSLYDIKKQESALKSTTDEREEIFALLVADPPRVESAVREYIKLFQSSPEIFPQRAARRLRDMVVPVLIPESEDEDVDDELELWRLERESHNELVKRMGIRRRLLGEVEGDDDLIEFDEVELDILIGQQPVIEESISEENSRPDEEEMMEFDVGGYYEALFAEGGSMENLQAAVALLKLAEGELPSELNSFGRFIEILSEVVDSMVDKDRHLDIIRNIESIEPIRQLKEMFQSRLGHSNDLSKIMERIYRVWDMNDLKLDLYVEEAKNRILSEHADPALRDYRTLALMQLDLLVGNDLDHYMVSTEAYDITYFYHMMAYTGQVRKAIADVRAGSSFLYPDEKHAQEVFSIGTKLRKVDLFPGLTPHINPDNVWDTIAAAIEYEIKIEELKTSFVEWMREIPAIKRDDLMAYMQRLGSSKLEGWVELVNPNSDMNAVSIQNVGRLIVVSDNVWERDLSRIIAADKLRREGKHEEAAKFTRTLETLGIWKPSLYVSLGIFELSAGFDDILLEMDSRYDVNLERNLRLSLIEGGIEDTGKRNLDILLDNALEFMPYPIMKEALESFREMIAKTWKGRSNKGYKLYRSVDRYNREAIPFLGRQFFRGMSEQIVDLDLLYQQSSLGFISEKKFKEYWENFVETRTRRSLSVYNDVYEIFDLGRHATELEFYKVLINAQAFINAEESYDQYSLGRLMPYYMPHNDNSRTILTYVNEGLKLLKDRSDGGSISTKHPLIRHYSRMATILLDRSISQKNDPARINERVKMLLALGKETLEISKEIGEDDWITEDTQLLNYLEGKYAQ